MEKNVKIFPVYKLFSYDTLFYYAISILYLTNVKHFNLSQVALVSCVYSLASILGQIPASIIANRIGLRNMMILGNMLCLFWGIIYIVMPSFTAILIAEVLSAIGFAFKAVSESPFLYSTLKKLGRISEFSKVESKGSTLYFLFEAIACIAAGYLYKITPYLPIIFSSVCTLIALILAFCTKPIKNLKPEGTTFKERYEELKFGIKFIFKSKRLHALLIFSAVFYGILSLGYLYIKTYLNEIQVPSEMFGYVFAIASIAAAVGSAIQDKIEKKHRNKTLTTISIIYVLSFILIGIASLIFTDYTILLIFGIGIYSIQCIIKGAERIIAKTYISRYTTASIRTRLTSIYYLSEQLGSTILLFIASKVIELTNIGIVYSLSGLILTAVLILILNYMDSRVGLKPENYTKRDRLDLEEEQSS